LPVANMLFAACGSITVVAVNDDRTGCVWMSSRSGSIYCYQPVEWSTAANSFYLPLRIINIVLVAGNILYVHRQQVPPTVLPEKRVKSKEW